MKDLIISLAVDGRERYSQKVKGLEKSLVHWHGDVRIFKEFPEWCTKHEENPYAFKYDLIQDAYNDGYRRIFWLDSSMRLLPGKNISHLLDKAPNGVVAFDNIGHPLYKYINDTAIINLRAENIESVKQTWGGAVFYDLSNEDCKWVFRSMQLQMAMGSFKDDNTKREGFVAHRHDQAILSYILHERGIELYPYGVIAAKQHITKDTYLQYAD
jgi:hypothetical protein